MKTLTQHRHLRDQLTLGLTLGAIAFIIIALDLALDHLSNLYAATHPDSPPPVHHTPSDP